MAFSSSSSSTLKYDVFVSFRGEDTRYGFVSHLLKALRDRGINTISDDDEGKLRGEEEISSSLIDTIQNSKIAIIVFSEDYASSRFCLEELSYILENFHLSSQIVIPVFYHVEPSHVRHQTGTYGEAFAMHDEEKWRDNKQKLEKWRNALNQVANIAGFFSGGYASESVLIEDIVRNVSTRLFHRAPLHNADTVGLESPLIEVCSLLELNSDGDDVHMLGIYGPTGIGKTTLAIEVYNRISHQFEASCFLPDARENSIIHGLPHLQNLLLSDMVGMDNIHVQSVQEGSFLIQRLRNKKVLLVLDGVDKLEQLEALVGGTDWFGSGSRIIVTTRDRHLLAFYRIERIYEVQPLNNRDALKLLRQQIFKEGNADPSNNRTLTELVTYAAGLPLTLKVISFYMFGKSVDEWTNALRQFKRVPPEDIHRKLKSSFDALREDEKRVFLDIACCFIGYESRKAMDILSAYRGPSVESHIKVLIDRSLVSIDSDDMVRLHPLVEGMGKEIVRQESPNEPGKRSRLWHPEDIVHVLRHNMGTDHTEIIHLGSPIIEDERPIPWDGEAFKKMKNLRTLIIGEWNFSKAPKYLPNSLRVLEWWKYPSHELPSDFNKEHLVICSLPDMGVLSTTVKNSLDKKIRFWGKEMDIRLLLSTLHQVMWPESGWEEISYMSLTESSQLKKAYRSALLLIHSDKLQKKGTTLIQKYIAENVFHILQSAKSVHEASQSSQEVSLTSQVSPTSMGVSGSMDPPSDPESEVSSNSSEEGEEPSNPPSDPEASSNSSQNGAEQRIPPSDPEGSHDTYTWFDGVDWKTWFWRVVGTLSGVVGPLCFALGPPSKCVSEEWKRVLFIACSFWSLFICVFLHCVKPTLFPKQHRCYTGYVVFLIISTYSFFYDKAIDNKPSVYSVVSNAAFALVSLSKSKLDDLGFETGTFCYFLACFTIQLMGIKSKLYLFGIILTCPLFLWHFPSEPQEQTLPQYSKNTTRPKSETKLQNLGKKAD